MTEMSAFAKAIMEQKYSHTLADGRKETWEEIAHRVATSVMGAVDAPPTLVAGIEQLIAERKFIPGGRYLYASGRPFKQTQNCLTLKAEDSREGWGSLMRRATLALMTGAGIGVVYSDVRASGQPIHKTGGTASGPLSLAKMVNESGRYIRQGGARRSAIWGGLHWSHPDIMSWIKAKNWSPEVKALKAKDYNFPADLDGTNISVLLDDSFFYAYKYQGLKHRLAQDVYWTVVRQMLETGEPGLSIDRGENAGENLRNAPLAGDVWVMTDMGYKQIESIVNQEVSVWTGKRWASTVFKKTKTDTRTVKIAMGGSGSVTAEPSHEFFVERYVGRGIYRKLDKIEKIKAENLQKNDILHVSLPMPDVSGLCQESYVLGYIYGDGSFKKDYPNNAEVTFCTEASKFCVEPFRNHPWVSSINENDGRGFKRAYLSSPVFANRNKVEYPNETMTPSQTASFIAGLFDSDGSYDSKHHYLRLASKHRSFLEGAKRALETIGIQSSITTGGISTYGQSQGYLLCVNSISTSRFAKIIPTIRIKAVGYEPYRKTTVRVSSVTEDKSQDVYCCDVGVEEHSFVANGVIVSNCCEISSRDDNDICNLGSINMARIQNLKEMAKAVNLGTAFLLAGTVYSDVPYAEVADVRSKNRRLGLGLMGLHEWLLTHGKKYGPDPELEEYLQIYQNSGFFANAHADTWNLSRPIKTRALAPNGTTSLAAETTSGIEPIFCVAYRRRYVKDEKLAYQYVVDPTAQRLIESGVQADQIEDAYALAENVERRVEFQAWMQGFVDHCISSTINLPAWGSDRNNESTVKDFGEMLMRYLPRLRGITVYPDGCRSAQPLSPVRYQTAIRHLGEVFFEGTDVCDYTKGSTCG